ncbi:MAG: sortase, partial [Coriobacteriia bacterium]|nr:sortase [Coriobacteriia bacterium]
GYTTTQSDLNAGEITNTVEATATFGTTDLTRSAAATVTAAVVPPTAADIRVTKVRTSAATTTVGSPVTWRITVENSGTATSLPVTIEDSWTAGAFAFVDSSPTPTSPQIGDTAVWALGTLDPSDIRTIDLTLTALTPGTHFNSAYSITTTSTTGTADVEVFAATPQLTLTKTLATGQSANVLVGDTATFTVTVRNSGNTTITSAAIVDTWDTAHLSWAGSSPTADAIDAAAGVATFTVPTQLGIGDSYRVDVALRVDSMPAGGIATNFARTDGVTDIGGNPVPDSSDSEDVNVTLPGAGIRVTKAYAPGHDQTVTQGQPIAFVLSVENTGTTTIDATIVDAWNSAFLTWGNGSPAPAALGSSSATWTVTGLAPGATHTINVSFTATGTGTTANNLSVNGTDTLGIPVSGTDSKPVTVVSAAVPGLSITKALASGQDPIVQVGGTASFVITARNTGDSTITAGSVVDSWDPAHLALTIANPNPIATGAGSATFALPTPLGPGASASYSLTFNVIGKPVSGVITNTARTTGVTDIFGTPVADGQSNATLQVTAPAKSVVKSLAPWQIGTAAVGEQVGFRIVVTNTGDTALPIVALTDTFDASLAFVSASIMPNSTGGSTLSWTNVGPLAPGDSRTIDTTFTVTATSTSKTATNRATAPAGVDVNNDPVPPSEGAAAIPLVSPGLTVTKTIADGQRTSVLVGEPVNYDIVVTNSGDTTLAAVPLVDTFPAQLTYTGASIAPSLVTNNPGGGGTIRFDDLTTSFGDLAPGQSVTITVRFVAASMAASVTNIATVDGATDVAGRPVPPATDDERLVAVTGRPMPTLNKTANPPAETILMPGDTIRYTLSFANTTTVDMTNVVITDIIPVEVQYLAGTLGMTYLGAPVSLTDATDADAGSVSGSTVRVNVGTVRAGTAGSVTFSVRVRPAEISRPGVFNTFNFNSTESGPVDSNTIRHPVDPFDITKTAVDVNGGRLNAGDEILWTIRVVNTGLVQTTEVVITDELPREVTYVNGSITGRGADDSNPRNLRWNIGVLPVGGEVTVTFLSTVNAGLPAGTEIRNFAVVSSKEAPSKASDDPATKSVGDPTMTRTGDNDWIWLLGMLVLLIAGIAVLLVAWRDRFAALAARAKAHRRGLATTLGVLLIASAVTVGVYANIDEVSYQLGLTDTIDLYESPVALDGAEKAVAAPAAKKPAVAGAGNRVIIPELGLDVPIGEREKAALAIGAWHQAGSATPDTEGNMVLAGHRRRDVFSLLHRLDAGDLIVVRWDGEEYRYQVAATTVVKPTQSSVIMRAGEDRLTLYTCIPRFLGDKRTVVTAYPVGE